jgi:zinc protease
MGSVTSALTCANNSARLTADDVNRAAPPAQVRFLRVVIVTKNAEALREAIVNNKPSPISYNAPKPKEILDEDKLIEKYRIAVKPDAVTTCPSSVFSNEP